MAITCSVKRPWKGKAFSLMEGKRLLKNIRNIYSLKGLGWKNSCSQHAELSLLLLSATHQATTEQLVLFAGDSRVEKVLMIKELEKKTEFHVIEES